jgi:hypothetical protein
MYGGVMGKKSQKGRPSGQSMSKHNDKLEQIILKIMRLRDLFRQLEPLFCNPTHYQEAQDCIDNLKNIYDELRDYVENSSRRDV